MYVIIKMPQKCDLLDTMNVEIIFKFQIDKPTA